MRQGYPLDASSPSFRSVPILMNRYLFQTGARRFVCCFPFQSALIGFNLVAICVFQLLCSRWTVRGVVAARKATHRY